MTITRSVVEEQNRERKVLMEKLKHSRAMEAQAVARWRDLARRLTHERAPWYFPECYPRSWELDPTEGPARVRIRLQRCHLKFDKRFLMPEHQAKLGKNPNLKILFTREFFIVRCFILSFVFIFSNQKLQTVKDLCPIYS